MEFTSIEEETTLPFDSIFLNDQLDRLIDLAVPRLGWGIKKYIVFHLLFFVAAITEVSLFIYFFREIVQYSYLAVSLGLIFFTFFSYFVFKIYIEEKKSHFLKAAKENYISSCKDLISFREGIPEHHIAVANACIRFSGTLQGKEETYYQFPGWLDMLNPTMQKISMFCHCEDIHTLRERLLTAAVEEHIKLVKCAPTDLEVHAALANAYVVLSGLYINPHQEDEEEESYFRGESARELLKRKFRAAAERAIEEFKIIKDYAPHDPWVHLQLAYSYHDLRMPEEEIREYEAVLSLCPEDNDVLFKLGVLYFQQGENAKGLEAYEALKACHFLKAEELIAYYGTYHLRGILK